jgi:hypothetical protein
MSFLVRLYPRAWRERYGDELEAVLEDRPPGPYEVTDLLFGALDAHLHLRGLGHRSEHRKGIPMSLRLAGSAAALGGGLWGLFFTMVGAEYANVGPDTGFAWILVVLVAGLLLLTALAGLSSIQFRAHSRSIWIAFLFPAAGIGIVLVGLVSLIPAGGTASEGTLPATVLYSGLCLMLIGSAVFAAVTVSTRALSRIAGAAIVVGFPPTLVGLFGFVAAAWLVVGGIVFGLGWVGLGIDAIRRDRRPVSADPVIA